VDAIVTSAFVVGLLGGVHCVAMCGGIVGALNLSSRRAGPLAVGPDGAAAARADGWPTQLPIHAAYSAGRIASYGVAGAVAGGVGGTAMLLESALPAQLALAVVAHALVVFLGLYLAGLGQGVAALERLGAGIWRRVSPFGRRFLPADTVPRALGVGAVWGWLPCGMVYSVLALALMSGSAGKGALVMLAFGLGTLPNLLAAGLAAGRIAPALRRPRVRLGAGLLVAALGVWGLVRVPGLAERIREGILCLA
jgi:sulfite exporter TauE/SafE